MAKNTARFLTTPYFDAQYGISRLGLRKKSSHYVYYTENLEV
jgi:hypothetical protein